MKKYLSLVLAIVLAMALVPNVVLAARVGDTIGYAQPTDIVATINGFQLESYNVDGHTYICVEDLRYYGFDVYYDNYSRSLSFSRNYGVSYIDPQNTNPNFWSIGSNNTKKKILYTDIVTYANGNYVAAANINGKTIINFNSLAAFGTVSYNNDYRKISLVMDDVNYNLVDVYADFLNENNGYNEGWKTIWRAKGNLLMLIGTARSYMNKDERNAYIKNKFPSDKSDMDAIRNNALSIGVPVSSVYIEARNTDGTVIASYQTK